MLEMKVLSTRRERESFFLHLEIGKAEARDRARLREDYPGILPGNGICI